MNCRCIYVDYNISTIIKKQCALLISCRFKSWISKKVMFFRFQIFFKSAHPFANNGTLAYYVSFMQLHYYSTPTVQWPRFVPVRYPLSTSYRRHLTFATSSPSSSPVATHIIAVRRLHRARDSPSGRERRGRREDNWDASGFVGNL